MRPGRTEAVAPPADETDGDDHDHAANMPSSQTPMSDSLNAWTESMTPDRVRKVPRMVRANVAHSSDRFQTRSMPRRSWTITEWM